MQSVLLVYILVYNIVISLAYTSLLIIEETVACYFLPLVCHCGTTVEACPSCVGIVKAT